MRPGPSTDALAGSVVVGVRMESMLGREVLATSIPAWDVVLDETDDRVVPGELTFTVPLVCLPTHDRHPLANMGQRVHVTQVLTCDGVPSSVEIGWYKIDSWSEEDDGVKVTARDLLMVLDENPLTWPSSPPAGATVLSEARRMCAPLPVVLDAGVVDRAVPRTTQWGTSRTENLRDLADSYGLAYRVEPDGYVHLRPAEAGGTPVAYYSAVDSGAPGARPGHLISAPRSSVDRRPNRWTVVGTQGSGDEEQQFAATVENTAPPFDPDTYGWVTARYEMNMATSQSQVMQAAQTRMRNAAVVIEVRRLEIPADSRLQRRDVISARAASGEIVVGAIKAFSLPVSNHDDSMLVDVEVQRW